MSFNSQPPEGGWFRAYEKGKQLGLFQLTAARRRLGGQKVPPYVAELESFNSQPPEGGWSLCQYAAPSQSGFNSQPPEGGWVRVISIGGA